MSKEGITKRQLEILEYIKSEILVQGYPPSVREICQAVQLKSTASVHSHLEALENKGYIKRNPNKQRAIEILEGTSYLAKREVAQVPVIGSINDSNLLLAQENIENYFPIPMELMSDPQTFIVTMKGSSMINAGILDGDYVIIEPKPMVADGTQAAVLINGSIAILTVYKEANTYRLQPENDNMNPIFMSEVEILGNVLGIMRFYK